jgi:hypothetical protein
MRFHRAHVAVALTAALVAATTGCGGSSTETVTAAASAPADAATQPAKPAEMTRATFITRGDQVCKAGNAAIRSFGAKANALAPKIDSGAEDLSALEAPMRGAYEAERRYIKALEAIAPPPADQAVIDKLSQAYEQQIALIGREADAASRGDTSAFASLADETQRAGDRARALAQGYGFKVCGASPGG